MNDIILKLRMLRIYGLREINDWYQEVWRQDPDEQICCSGQMCGCEGACYYQQWEWAIKRSLS